MRGPDSHSDEENGLNFAQMDSPDTKESSHRSSTPSLRKRNDIVGWDGPDDPENPFNWSKSRRWVTTLLCCVITVVCGFNSTAITAGSDEITQEFSVQDKPFANSYWPVFSWTVAAAIVPLVGLPLTETFGTRPGYLLFYTLFVIFIFPQAFAQNFATLIVSRVFAGGFAGITINLIGGIIGNVWEGERARSRPMSLYILANQAGFNMGSVIGGAIIQYLHWRWIFYIQLMIYGAVFPIALFMIPETRADVILKARARRIRSTTGKEVYSQNELDHPGMKSLIKTSIGRPLYMLTTEYVVISITLWGAFCFGNVLLFTQSISTVYEPLYGFSASQTSYVQSAVFIGNVLAFFAQIPADRLYYRSASRNTEKPGHYIPEARLYASIPASFIGLGGGFFVYAWTSFAYVHWIFPTIGLVMAGFGIFTVVIAGSNYLEDAYAKYAASALAAITFGENLVAGTLPLAEMSLYNTLGLNWASTLLGCIAILLSFAPVVLVLYGKKIRARSPFMKEASFDD